MDDVIQRGDSNAYYLLAQANLLSHFDILKVSIISSRKYGWNFAYYNTFQELVEIKNNLNYLDSATKIYAIYNLEKAASLNHPEAFYTMYEYYNKGIYYKQDTILAEKFKDLYDASAPISE